MALLVQEADLWFSVGDFYRRRNRRRILPLSWGKSTHIMISLPLWRSSEARQFPNYLAYVTIISVSVSWTFFAIMCYRTTVSNPEQQWGNVSQRELSASPGTNSQWVTTSDIATPVTNLLLPYYADELFIARHSHRSLEAFLTINPRNIISMGKDDK